MATQTITPNKPKTNDPGKYARLALPLMAQHGVEPNPHNYAVWYEYVMGVNRMLIAEIDEMVNRSQPFTGEVNDYLYRRYIAQDDNKQAIQEASEKVMFMLAEMVKLVDVLSNDTGNYSKDLDDFTATLVTQVKGEMVRPMVDTLVRKTKSLKEKNQTMNKRLEASGHQIEHLKHDLEKVTLESTKDFLTGAGNRKAFDTEMKQRTSDARSGGQPLCLLMIDIDYFKKFNDKWGHQLGDEVLRVVSRTIMEALRGSDFIGRYGGEEFAVLLPETPLSGALVVAEKLRQSVSAKVLRRRDTGEVYSSVTVSIGAALFRPAVDTSETFIQRADEALYKSKMGGRNKVTQEDA